MNPTWGIIDLLTEDRFGYTNVVVGIFYLIEYDGRSSTGFVNIDIGEDFIDFYLLTEEIVLGWLFKIIDKTEQEDKLISYLPVVQFGKLPNLPWLL